MHTIKKVQPQENYHITITFDTGEVFEYDLSNLLNKGVFQELKDKKKFKQVFINPESKTVTWSNGIDLCPDSLYQKYLAK